MSEEPKICAGNYCTGIVTDDNAYHCTKCIEFMVRLIDSYMVEEYDYNHGV